MSGLPTLIGPYEVSADAGHYWRLRQDRKSKFMSSKPYRLPSLRQIVDRDNLISIFQDLKHNGGQAPGADRIAYREVGNRELARIVEVMHLAVLGRAYQPHPGRKVKIPKSDGISYRELTLRSIFDRLIATALHRGLDPLWEGIFDDRSMAWRPHRSHHLLLARLERDMIQNNAWVLTTDDVKQAFDHAHVPTIMKIHERYIRDQEVLHLVETVLKGGDLDKEIGIDQGSAYSPVAMNALLDDAHDKPLEVESPIPAWYRFGDNLAYASRTVPEGHQVIDQVRQRLNQVGLTLKGKDGPPKDLLRGDIAHLLGFQLSQKDGRLVYRPGQEAWQQLTENLMKVHEADNPPRTACAVVRGWINAYGPAFGVERSKILKRILHMAGQLGFRELATEEKLEGQLQDAWKYWNNLQDEVKSQETGTLEGKGPVKVSTSMPGNHKDTMSIFRIGEPVTGYVNRHGKEGLIKTEGGHGKAAMVMSGLPSGEGRNDHVNSRVYDEDTELDLKMGPWKT